MPDLKASADELKQRGLRLLYTQGLLLPKPVRDLIADLLAVVAELAKQQNYQQARLEAGPQEKGCDHGESEGGRG